MRIVTSSTATVTTSCSPVVLANVRASHGSTIASGLEQVSNFPQLQRPVQPAILIGLPTRAMRPLVMQPPAAAAGMATSVPTPAWPVPPQWCAATSAQPDTPATHIVPASATTISEASGLRQPLRAAATASQDIKEGSRCTGAMLPCEQSPQTIEALQEWHRMTPDERAKKGCLYDFLKSQGAPMADTKGRRLAAATVDQFEWLMRRETGLPLQGYASFLEERGPTTPRYVLAEGMLTELGAELFEPILRQAGLVVPPIAESMPAWRERVRPLIEKWCVEDLSTPQSLNEFVDEHSPGRTATQTQKTQLITLEFHLMSQIPDLRQKGQWHETRSALELAHGFPERNLRCYIAQRGALPAGSPLWQLLPASLQGQARPVTEQQARWRDLVRLFVAQWCASSAPGRESLRQFVEGLLPKKFWIKGQGPQLVGLHYYLMKKFPEEMGEEQSAESLKLEGFAAAQSVKSAAVRKYVLDCGRLQGLGEHFELLVPQSLLEQSRDRSVAAGLGPHAVPGGEPEAAAAQGIASRTHAVASDGQLLAPASKRMRMDPEVMQSTAFHTLATVLTPPTPQWDAATNAESDMHTVSMPAMSEASDALPQGYLAFLGNSDHMSPHFVHAEDVLSADAVAAMEPILATDPPTAVDDDAIDPMPESWADLADDSLAELDCDWDDIDSRIAAYREQW